MNKDKCRSALLKIETILFELSEEDKDYVECCKLTEKQLKQVEMNDGK